MPCAFCTAVHGTDSIVGAFCSVVNHSKFVCGVVFDATHVGVWCNKYVGTCCSGIASSVRLLTLFEITQPATNYGCGGGYDIGNSAACWSN